MTRELCGDCGTHIVTRRPDMADTLVLEIGTLDDPGVYGHPVMAILTIDRQALHHVPDGVPGLERMPPRG